MAPLVVDSSVIIKWFLPEPLAAGARAIRAGAQDGALALLASDLIYVELGNIVWKKRTMHGLAAADAQRVIAAVRALPLVVTATAHLLEDAYTLAVAHERNVYDALYLALSVREHCPFVTRMSAWSTASASPCQRPYE